MNEFSINNTIKTGNEPFLFDNSILNFTLIDFWKWNTSDLLNNALRGKLAEYIIAKALGTDSTFRVEWDEIDLIYNNLKIEIKSCAYIQSWEQNKHSSLMFGIKPTYNSNWTDFKRQSDYYIFAVLAHKEASTINPLRLEQWEFFILKTSILNEKRGIQKTITMNSLLELGPVKSDFQNLKEQFNKYCSE